MTNHYSPTRSTRSGKRSDSARRETLRRRQARGLKYGDVR